MPGSGWAFSVARRQRQEQREARAAPLLAVEFQRHPQRRHQALDDRKPQPQPLRHARAMLEAAELGEDQRMLVAVEADAGVDHVEPQPRAARRTPTSTCPPGRVYLMAFDTRFCTTRADQCSVADRRRAGFDEPQPHAASSRRERGELHLDLLEQVAHLERRVGGLHRTRIEPRDIEQRRHDLLDRRQRLPRSSCASSSSPVPPARSTSVAV
jgi:hypothetical protein